MFPDTTEIQSFLDIQIHTQSVPFQVLEKEDFKTYSRQLIQYQGNEKDEIKAYLFIPVNQPIRGSVLVHHQHAGKRHWGKSEVAGLVGDEFQFFCPALAEKGIITLAPDSICFEDRRKNMTGIEPAPDPDDDWLQHYNEMTYRLLEGNSLMKKVIEDSSFAISLLENLPEAPNGKIGILGHSYGGNTVIFHSPFDDRIALSCSSGAVCRYRTKFQHQTGIEMAEVIPGFTVQYDIEDLLANLAPRKLLIVGADQDKYSRDARDIFRKIFPVFDKKSSESALTFREFTGGHGLNKERFDYIVDWFANHL